MQLKHLIRWCNFWNCTVCSVTSNPPSRRDQLFGHVIDDIIASHKSRVLCDRETDHIFNLLSTTISGMVASLLDVLTLASSFSSHVTLISTNTNSHAPSLVLFVHLPSFPPPCPTLLIVSALLSHGSNPIARHPLFFIFSLQPPDHTHRSLTRTSAPSALVHDSNVTSPHLPIASP